MMLTKLMPTLAISIAPAATRRSAMSASAPRRKVSRIALVLGGGGADHLQHVADGRLILGRFVSDRSEQRLHLSEIVGGKPVNGAAKRGPVGFELLVEVELPLLRF